MLKRFFGFLLGLFSVVVGVAPTATVSASASISVDVDGHTSVLEDLHNDPDFDETLYPKVEGNHTLDVITVAESAAGELFVYVYQPGAEKIASSINISTTLEENAKSYHNYPLTLLSIDGVFQKYCVDVFVVKCDPVRVYEIPSIFRPFDASVDKPAEGEGQTISEVSFPVGKRFEMTSKNDGGVDLSVTDIELITVTDKYVGFVRYRGGYHLFGHKSACDGHFIAFSTDKRIDDLLEAEIFYKEQDYSEANIPGISGSPTTVAYFDIVSRKVRIDNLQGASYDGGGFLSKTYLKDRIVSSKDFLAEEDRSNLFLEGTFNIRVGDVLSASSINNIKNKQWVIRFAETEFSESTAYGTWAGREGTIISDVSILRLKFETGGQIYNLGVVDNKQTGSKEAVNTEEISMGLAWWVWLILAIIALVLLAPLISFVVAIFKLIFAILKFLWRIISVPLKLIGWSGKKISKVTAKKKQKQRVREPRK